MRNKKDDGDVLVTLFVIALFLSFFSLVIDFIYTWFFSI